MHELLTEVLANILLRTPQNLVPAPATVNIVTIYWSLLVFHCRIALMNSLALSGTERFRFEVIDIELFFEKSPVCVCITEYGTRCVEDGYFCVRWGMVFFSPVLPPRVSARVSKLFRCYSIQKFIKFSLCICAWIYAYNTLWKRLHSRNEKKKPHGRLRKPRKRGKGKHFSWPYGIYVRQRARQIEKIEFYQWVFTQTVCDMSTKI